MGTFELEHNGKTYEVEAPDQAAALSALPQIEGSGGATAPDTSHEAPGMFDRAKEFGKGLVRGAAGAVGDVGAAVTALPKDIASLAGGNLHRDRPELEYGQNISNAVGAERSPDERLHAAGTVGEVFGSPVSMLGPGTVALKAGGGVLSAGGAELGRATGIPGAELVGSIAGGGAAGAASAESTALRNSAKLPSADAIKQSAQAAYKAVANAKLRATQASIDTLTTDLKTGLDNDLIVESTAPRTFKAIDKLQAAGGDVGQIMGIRQKLGEIPPDAGTEYAAATHVKDAIDNFVDGLQPHEVVTGDPKFTSAMLDHARSSWRAYRKIEQVEHAGEIGEHRAGASGTGANTQNAMRQRIREILDSDKKSRGFSPEAKAKMEEIVMGTTSTNAARFAGKYAPSGPVSATTSILAGLGAGAPVGAGVAIGTTLAKHLGTYLTKRQLRDLEDMIRAESPIGAPIAAQNAVDQSAANQGAIAQTARSALTSPLAPGQ